jgi:hypothetical protein
VLHAHSFAGAKYCKEEAFAALVQPPLLLLLSSNLPCRYLVTQPAAAALYLLQQLTLCTTRT